MVFPFCFFQCVHLSPLKVRFTHKTARCPTPPLPKQWFSRNQRENSCKLNYLSAARFEVADGGWILQAPFALFLHFWPVFMLILSVQTWLSMLSALQGTAFLITPNLGLWGVELLFICRVREEPSDLYRIKVLQQPWYLKRKRTQGGMKGLPVFSAQDLLAGWIYLIFHFPSSFGFPNTFY